MSSHRICDQCQRATNVVSAEDGWMFVSRRVPADSGKPWGVSTFIADLCSWQCLTDYGHTRNASSRPE